MKGPTQRKAKNGGPYDGCEVGDVHAEINSLAAQIPVGPPATILSFKMPDDGHCVYMLLWKGRVMYVGQSISMLGRLGSHRKKKRRSFDEVQYFILPSRRCLCWAEFTLIRKFRPPYNGQVPSEGELAKATDEAQRYFVQRVRGFNGSPTHFAALKKTICEMPRESGVIS